MKRRIVATVTVIVALVGFAMAQTMSGRWSGDQKGPGDTPRPIVLDITLAGSKVTGTLTSGSQPAVPITNAKVDGAKITFNTVNTLPAQKIESNWTGELKGEQLTLTREMFSGGRRTGAFPVTLTRKK